MDRFMRELFVWEILGKGFYFHLSGPSTKTGMRMILVPEARQTLDATYRVEEELWMMCFPVVPVQGRNETVSCLNLAAGDPLMGAKHDAV
jgi:hypothetical protein